MRFFSSEVLKLKLTEVNFISVLESEWPGPMEDHIAIYRFVLTYPSCEDYHICIALWLSVFDFHSLEFLSWKLQIHYSQFLFIERTEQLWNGYCHWVDIISDSITYSSIIEPGFPGRLVSLCPIREGKGFELIENGDVSRVSPIELTSSGRSHYCRYRRVILFDHS